MASGLKAIEFKIKGITPLYCHNGRLADPLDHFAEELKKISGKRKKTKQDYIDMAKVEFLGGLYTDDDGRPVIPGVNIEAMLTEAAKKKKMGPQAKLGIICEGNYPIEYDGPKDPEKLWETQDFHGRDRAVVGTSCVMRTRPKFRSWGLTFVVQFMPDVLNQSDVEHLVQLAGEQVGLGDWTPKHGRFELVTE